MIIYKLGDKYDDKSSPYGSLIRFILYLNQMDNPQTDQDQYLAALFTDKINPAILQRKNLAQSRVKAFYPLAGSDSICPFLLPHVTEVVMFDWHYFFNPETELKEEVLQNLASDYLTTSFSGFGNFDTTSRQSLNEKDVVQSSAKTLYHVSGIQTYFPILIRLKVQFGARFEQVSMIDPQYPDLGFRIEFTDQQGKKKILQYFQRTHCYVDGIATRGYAPGASQAVRTDAIKAAVADSDLVLFKACSGFSESRAATFVLDMVPSNALIISDAPYDERYAKWLYKNSQNLQFLTGTGPLGYEEFPDKTSVMISEVETYKMVANTLNYPWHSILTECKEVDLALKHLLSHIFFAESMPVLQLLNATQLYEVLNNLLNSLETATQKNEKINDSRLVVAVNFLLGSNPHLKVGITTFMRKVIGFQPGYLLIFLLLNQPKFIEPIAHEYEYEIVILKEFLAGEFFKYFESSDSDKNHIFYKLIFVLNYHLQMDIKVIEKIIQGIAKNKEGSQPKLDSYIEFLNQTLNVYVNTEKTSIIVSQLENEKKRGGGPSLADISVRGLTDIKKTC